MKLYKNLVNTIAETLREIFEKNAYADKAIERLFKKNPKWGSRDRRFVAEGIYDIVRYYRLFSLLAGYDITDPKKNYWFITASWLVVKKIEIPDWSEFRHLDPEHILREYENLKQFPVIFESYPDWLWETGKQELGNEVWEREAKAMNEQAAVILRVNTLKTSAEKFEAAFKKDNIGVIKINGLHDTYQLEKRENVFRHPLFKEGWFEVQDAGSQMIGEFVNPGNGENVIDACAGAGGKSLHLAALLKNKGRVISMDVEAWKLEELKKRAKRAGAFNIETRLIEGNKTIKRLEEKADKVLLDVPCSGLGVIKRNPDTKWKLTPEALEKNKMLQGNLLSEYSIMVKRGGSLFYSTCSLLPSENQEQVKKFLNLNTNFTFVKDKSVFPSEGFDGFYMCELKKQS